jgi:hypothetical protein
MNGIVGTPEKANIHASLVSSFAGTLGKLNCLLRNVARRLRGIVRWFIVALSVWT